MSPTPSQNTPPARSADTSVVDVVGAVIRDGKSLIPNGATMLQPGDHAVIVTASGRLTGLDQILEGEK